MANFQLALEKVLKHEGGYVNDSVDRGGETYKGIARNMHPNWIGWKVIDSYKTYPDFPANIGDGQKLQQSIELFYKTNFWNPMQGDKIHNQFIAESIFDFCVNAGIKTGVMIAQTALEVKADGVVGPVTLGALNTINPDLFLASFTLGKIARYVHLVKNRPANSRFFFGWIRRAIGDI